VEGFSAIIARHPLGAILWRTVGPMYTCGNERRKLDTRLIRDALLAIACAVRTV
jgi:hypothetical protein